MVEAIQKAFSVIRNNLPRENSLLTLLDRINLVQPHEYPCGVGKNYLVILPDGRIAKCQMDQSKPVTSADETDPLEVVIKNTSGIQNLSVDLKEDCAGCQWRYWCAGGCPLMAYPNSNCQIYKQLIPDLILLEGLRLLKHEKPWQPEIFIN